MKTKLRKNFTALMMLLIVPAIVAGCGAKVNVKQIKTDEKYTYSDEKYTVIDVIINDEHINDEKYGSIFVGKLKDVFGDSFGNVSVRTGYDTPKPGELLLLPLELDVPDKELDTSNRSRILFYCDSNVKIKILTTDYSKSYNFSSRGEFCIDDDLDAIEDFRTLIATFPISSEGVDPADIISKNQAIKGLSIGCYNSVVSSSEFTHFANQAK